MTSIRPSNKPAIAVVAMSGVFPKAVGAERFWRNMIEKIDGSTEIPENRLPSATDDVYGDATEPDKAYSRRAFLIDGFRLDAKIDSLDARLWRELDPFHQWVMFAAHDALSQIKPLEESQRKSCGAILAAIALPTALSSRHARNLMAPGLIQSLQAPSPASDPDVKTGNICERVVGSPAALVCRMLGLQGGGYTLDAACASSLYALKLSCDKLQNYEADVMLTGGGSGADTVYTQIGFSQLRALSRSGRCAPFDHRADGLMVGEGVGILVLKRLKDALADQDTIYGIIRGIGLSNDMRGNLLAPESAGQLRAMCAAYEMAGWSPSDVAYIECHGAGTPVGDATELTSLKTLWQSETWQPGQCALGAVKSMVGHLLTGAGAAGMIRTLLALHHKTLPPTLNFQHPSADSPLVDSPFRVPTSAEPWPERNTKVPRRAAVSAFGFGGINAHVLIEAFDRDMSGPSSGERYDVPAQVRQATNEKSHQPPQSPTHGVRPPVAIVGMAVHLGALTNLTAFEQAIFNGQSALGPVPTLRWKSPPALASVLGELPAGGGFIDRLAIALGEFQIPPGEIPDILPQQLLMLKTAAGALQDAGLPIREMRSRMGTVIGIAFDYEATNFHLRWSLPRQLTHWSTDHKRPVDRDKLKDWIKQARDGCGPPLTSTRTLGALGGIVASRIAREFRFGGPSFVVSAEEASGLRALEISIDLLQSRDIDAMLVGAVDLHCDERNLASLAPHLPLSPTSHVAPFDRLADGTLPGEGAVALVLKRLDDAVADVDRIYAVVDGLGSAGSAAASEEAMARVYDHALQRALQRAGVAPEQITLFETHGSAIPMQDAVETRALHQVFATASPDQKKTIAVGTLKPLVGHTGASSGLASLVKAALCLYHRMLAPAVNYRTPVHHHWSEGPFYFPHKPVFWVRNRSDGPRYAGVASLTHDGNCLHAILSQYPQDDAGNRNDSSQTTPEPFSKSLKMPNGGHRPLGALPASLFLLHGASKSELLHQLDHLTTISMDIEKNSGRSPHQQTETLAHDWFVRSVVSSKDRSRVNLAIVADTIEALNAFCAQARRAIQQDQTLRFDRQGGIAYLPDFRAEDGRTALAFPGSGNHYLGMGRTLSARFPDIMYRMDVETERLQDQWLPHLYNPRRSDWSSGWQSDAYGKLIEDPLHTIFGQVLFAGQMTHLLQAFGIRPDAVIGYSLGESAGLFALGAWPDRGQMLARLKASDLFKNQLAGEGLAIRQAWRLPASETVRWHVAAVNRPADAIDAAIADLPHVRRLIINTAEECVIGGLKDQVNRAIERLGCDAVILDGVVAVHCDAAEPVAQAYKDLHRFEARPVAGMDFYSCAWGRSYEPSTDAAAQSILDQALYGFDFPKLVNQAYTDGVRTFIEAGPHASCTRMIGRILGDRPHLAVAANNRSEEESFSLLACLGTLAAAGMAVDLTPLYGYAKEVSASGNAASDRIIEVPVGGRPFAIPPLPMLSEPTDQGVQKHRAPDGHFGGARDPEYSPPTVSSHKNLPEVPATPSDKAPDDVLRAFDENVALTAEAHQQFLDFSKDLRDQLVEGLDLQRRLLEQRTPEPKVAKTEPLEPFAPPELPTESTGPEPAFTREQCMAFAVGSVGKVLGPDFDIIDTYATRVRLPDEPLMLVDRIMAIEGQPRSLGAGRIVTEHDVLPRAWYLDGNRAPVCISVEAGQADLFLSAYLGIDHQVKGQRTYRLLDARIVFNRGLPQPGETIRYDIHIDKFVRQGETYLFFFRYEGHIGDQHLITMTEGCAGFFTEEEVRQSGGILLTDEDRRNDVQVGGAPFLPIVLLADESYNDHQLEALRRGDVQDCFGAAFQGIHLPEPLCLPSGRMRLIHRIVVLEPKGGRFGKGFIKAEADVHPDDWFLTCHFVDDMVMPGTLMYECCAHTLRVLLLRLGWITDQDHVAYEPVQGVPCRLKCRGPVTPATRKVHYVVEIKEIGYGPEPYVITDAHMYADGRYIVFFKDMSMQITGIDQARIESFWRRHNHAEALPDAPPSPVPGPEHPSPPPLFSHDHILEFAVGRPSKAFGDPYAMFDEQRKIARLPGPPYCFIHRIVAAEPEPWVLQSGGWVTAQYDVLPDAWYFAADRSGCMPFGVLLEIALQPCGWLAAYLGSALRSPRDLKFRNLGGQGVMHANIYPESQTITMRARLTKFSEAADMIIEHFDFQVLSGDMMIYEGATYFGFFTAQALSQQKGLQESTYTPTPQDLMSAEPLDLPMDTPWEPDDVPTGRIFKPPGLTLPAKALAMIDTIEGCSDTGGPHGLGFVRGSKKVDPDEWFFKAHFYQDPVCPGSLGIESFLQLIRYAAIGRWPDKKAHHRFEMLTGVEHQWSYRGQVIPTNRKVVVDAMITAVEDKDAPIITADGCLHVDSLSIYKMSNFGLRLVPM